MMIAIIEPDGMADFNHPDLVGRRAPGWVFSGRLHGHATMVAGLAVANRNDASHYGGEKAIAGVAYESYMESFDSRRMGTWLANYIRYSAQQGFRIINISQQGNNFQALRQNINYAIANLALVVAAAGNRRKDGTACTPFNTWPAKYNMPGLLAVGATDENDVPAEWTVSGIPWCSNTANWIDLYAPGKSLYSTTSGSSTKYASQSGTSYAAALTSGAAAVLWARNPGWRPQDVSQKLIVKGDLISHQPCRNGNCRRLDIFSALQ